MSSAFRGGNSIFLKGGIQIEKPPNWKVDEFDSERHSPVGGLNCPQTPHAGAVFMGGHGPVRRKGGTKRQKRKKGAWKEKGGGSLHPSDKPVRMDGLLNERKNSLRGGPMREEASG